jgi:hypothetical protein
MLAKFGVFNYFTVNNVKAGINIGAFFASLYKLYTNPHEYTASFLLDMSTHGATLLSMRQNATAFEKYAAMFLNSTQESNLVGSLVMGGEELPTLVKVIDGGVHLYNLATAPLPTDENENEATTIAPKMK